MIFFLEEGERREVLVFGRGRMNIDEIVSYGIVFFFLHYLLFLLIL